MFHTRHFSLLIFGITLSGLFAASVMGEEAFPHTLLPGPIFTSPEEAYALVPSDSFPDYRKKDAFVAKVRSRLVKEMAVAPAPEPETLPLEVAPESSSYPNTTPEPLAYEELTVETEVASTSTPIDLATSTAATSTVTEAEEDTLEPSSNL